MSLPPLFSRPSTRLIGARKSSLDVARGRLVFMGFCFAAIYVLVAARVMDLTLIQGELPRLTKAVFQEGGMNEAPVPVANRLRGDITDRNGVLLARSLKTPSLFANTTLITDPEQVARDLVKVLPDLKYGDVLQKLQRKTQFVWIKRNISPNSQYAILNLGYPGLNFQDESHRIYPQADLTSHIVGYTDVDGKGLGGVERSFDEYLKKGDGALTLSMDIRLQHVLRRELQKSITEFSGLGGGGVIMDVNTGEVLAAVSLPDFNPHNVRDKDKESLFSRLTLGVYEMGSTFKIFSTAALLELKNVSMGKTFDATEPIKIGRFSIRDFHAENRPLTIPEIFMVSSNIGAAKMGDMIGTRALRDFYKDLGLMDPLQMEVSEIGRPIIPNPWREVNTLTASFGHGIAVTPMQTVAAVASIINGGLLVHPTVIMDGEAVPDKKAAKANRNAVRVVSDETSHRMRQLLRLVVSDGTAKSANIPGFDVGGKTGSAEKPMARGYDRKRILSSFIGVFPMHAPRYAVLIMVDEPRGTKATHGYATGGWVAAPAAGRVITAMAPILGLVPEDIDPKNDLATPLKPYVRDKKTGGQLATFNVE